jgi:hypothetical protein
LREEHKLQESESKVLRKISERKKDEKSNLIHYIKKNFVIYTGHLLLKLG